MKALKKILFIACAFLLIFVVASCDRSDGVTPGQLATPVTDTLKLTREYEGKKFLENGIGLVTRVSPIDGDTARFQYDSVDWFSVRFLCINTPESTANLAPWGKEASDFCKKVLNDAVEIVLESSSKIDGPPEKDTNNTRYLGYVWYRNSMNDDFRCLNLEMIEQCFSYYTGEATTDTYGETFREAFTAVYKLRTTNSDGEQTRVGVFGQKAGNYDYSTKIVEITLAELRNNYSNYSTGTNLKVKVRVVRSIGYSLYVEDVEETTDPDTNVTSKAGMFVYHSYKISGTMKYDPGTVLEFECQATETDDYGRQLVNPSKINVIETGTDVVIQEIPSDVTNLRNYEGFVVLVRNFTLDSLGTPSESGAYTIYGHMSNGAALQIRVDGSLQPMIAHSSGYLAAGNVYDVIGGVGIYTPYGESEPIYQLKLGNFNRDDLKKLNN